MTLNPPRVLLAIILFVYLALATLYAVETPKWQAPDEPAHFNYIRTIGETGRLPVLWAGDYNQDYLEQIKAAKFPDDMSIDSIRYESYQPPLYYLAATPVYLAARPFGLDVQVIALRLFSAALEVIVLLLAFTIVRAIFPDQAVPALATAALMATIPMHIAITASISNDAAAELVLASLLLLAVKRVQSRVSIRQFVILGGILFGAALLVKSTTYLTGALLLIGAELGVWFQNRNGEPAVAVLASHGSRVTHYATSGSIPGIRLSHPLSHLLALFLIALVISAPMFARNMLTYGIADPLGLARHDSVVVGQPTTAQMIGQNGLKHVAFDFFAVTFRSFWGQFGWMGVPIDDRIYAILAVLMALALVGFALYAFRAVRYRQVLSENQHWALGLFLLLAVTGFADYLGYQIKFYQLQGRYLFPALIPITFALVVGLCEILAARYRRLLFALAYVGMVGLDFACLFLYIIPQLRFP